VSVVIYCILGIHFLLLTFCCQISTPVSYLPPMYPLDPICRRCIRWILSAADVSVGSYLPPMHPLDPICRRCIRWVLSADASVGSYPPMHPLGPIRRCIRWILSADLQYDFLQVDEPHLFVVNGRTSEESYVHAQLKVMVKGASR
jgi:hypothetical protein